MGKGNRPPAAEPAILGGRGGTTPATCRGRATPLLLLAATSTAAAATATTATTATTTTSGTATTSEATTSGTTIATATPRRR